mmetsp:Transcript_15715/g.23808  ORF Transcript_15715/g.23808 Transcript_15715/m.23808 type:complete len:81 (-) Transcript_15715:868-1110(-)
MTGTIEIIATMIPGITDPACVNAYSIVKTSQGISDKLGWKDGAADGTSDMDGLGDGTFDIVGYGEMVGGGDIILNGEDVA